MRKAVTKLMSLLLAGLLVITIVPADVFASTESKTETFEGGYRDNEKLLSVDYASSRKPNRATIPSAYQSTLAELEKYPTTRDQGNYGTCWAFAALAAAEFSMIEEGKTTSSVDYSELALAYFTYNTVKDPFGGTNGDVNKIADSYTESGINYLTLGGNTWYTTRILAAWTGAVNESNVPYSGAENSLTNGINTKYAFKNNVAVLKNAKIVDIVADRSAAKELLMEHGALVIAYHHDYQYAYNGTYYCPEEKGTNHAVAVVGWDDNYSKNNFRNTPAGDGAWLVRNSWQSSGNEINGDSYFWLSYYDKTFEKEAYAYEFMSTSEYANNVQYDGAAQTLPTGYNKAANIFKVNKTGGEILKAVQLCSMYQPDVTYKIEVYRGVTSTTNPTKGTKVSEATTTGTISYAGIYTIPLKSEVVLDEGSKYSVVITLTGASYGVEAEVTHTSWIDITAHADKGESFIYNDSKSAWVDVVNEKDFLAGHEYGNIAIKALTANAQMLSTPIVKAANTSSAINVTWNKVANATNYKLYRRVKGGSWGSALASFASTDTMSYSDKTVEAGKTYQYLVVASNSTKTSSKTAEGTEVVCLRKPTGLKATKGTSGVTVSWTKVSGATGYAVYRKKSTSSKYSLVGEVTTNKFVDKKAYYKSKYYYYVVAKAGDSTSVKSSSVAKTVSKLYAPAAVSAKSVKSTSVKISWERRYGADGYYVYRATSKTGTYKQIKKITKGSTVSFTDSGLTIGKTYYYKVKSYKGSTKSSYSSVASAKPTVKETTMGTTASATASTIKVSWTKVSEANGYYVYRRKSTSDSWKKVATISSNATTTYKDTGVSGKYYYTVAAYKTSGTKTYTSAKAEAIRTSTLGKTKILEVTAAEDFDGFGISWSLISNATGYQIYAKKSSASTYKLAKTISDAKQSYGEISVELDVSMDMKVRAIYKSNGCTTYGPFSVEEIGWSIQ